MQEPKLCSVPGSVASTENGELALEFAESLGIRLDPWQQYLVRMIFATDATGDWAAFENVMVVARQNGKGEVLLVVELADLFLFGANLVLHSAHEFKTSVEAFLRLRAVVESTPHLAKRVRTIHKARGDEGIELVTGQRLRFVARSRGSTRGFTADTLILDEVQELPAQTLGATIPTLAALPNPHIVAAGTVPTPESESDYLDALRDRALEGDDPGLFYAGWTLDLPSEDAYNVALEDRDVWMETNPALGYRMTDDAISREARSLPVDQFARERLSVWPLQQGSSLVDLDKWAALSGVEDARPTPVVLGVSMSPDRKWCTIGLAGLRSDGAAHLQVVESGRGSSWVADRVATLVESHEPETVVVDPSGPEGSLLRRLRDRGVDVTEIPSRKYQQSCGRFLDDVEDGRVHHQSQRVLDIAVENLQKKRVGDAFVFMGRGDVDVSPAKAVVVALAYLPSERKTRRRSRVRVLA